jgi:hypothetical protein
MHLSSTQSSVKKQFLSAFTVLPYLRLLVTESNSTNFSYSGVQKTYLLNYQLFREFFVIRVDI